MASYVRDRMQIRHVIGIALLVAAVSLQVFMTKYTRNVNDFVSGIVRMLPDPVQEGLSVVDFTAYVNAANDRLQRVYGYFGLSDDDDDDDDDNSADEEAQVPDELIRHFRPPHMEFRIGEVVLTRKMIVGVIIGWGIDMADLSKEPEYVILAENQNDYIKEFQNYIIGLENIEINHEMIDQYFDNYDGFKYIPRKWLQKMYPKD